MMTMAPTMFMMSTTMIRSPTWDFNMLLQQKSMQMDKKQVNNNNNKAKKQELQEQLSSPLSQVLRTYDFGSVENCELKVELSELSLTSYPQLYHEQRVLHKTIWLNMYLSCSPVYLWYKNTLVNDLPHQLGNQMAMLDLLVKTPDGWKNSFQNPWELELLFPTTLSNRLI